jgi:hypothetical protein
MRLGQRVYLAQGPFRYGLIERWFVRQMEPPARMTFKAPKAYLPSAYRPYPESVTSFYSLQDDFLACIEEAKWNRFVEDEGE